MLFKQVHSWLGALSLSLAIGATSASAQTIFAINNSATPQLVKFDRALPGAVTIVGPLVADGVPIELDALDFSLLNGNLYGYSYQYDEIFQVDTATGALTSVAISNVVTRSRGLGFEFQPVSGGFHLVDDAGDNFVFDTAFVGLAKTPPAYISGDSHFGTAPLIGDIGYANTVAGATTTTLYGIDYGIDSLVRLGGNPATSDGGNNDPASGRVQTVGALGFNTSDFIGFDITEESGINIGYAILTAPATPTSPRLFRINLTTGAATQVGAIGGGVSLFGLAVQPSRLTGTIQFEAQSQPSTKTVQFVLKPSVGENITLTRDLHESGAFVLTGIPAGTYTLHASASKFLAKSVTVTINNNPTDAGTLLLRAGDASNDNFADIQDLLLLIVHYNQTQASADYLEAVDFNGDGNDDIADLLILIGNYNVSGDSLP